MTAVEWFFRWFNDNLEATHKEYAEAFQQALEMEKQQIKDAYIEGKFNSDIKDIAQSSEQYYFETYKKDNP